MDEKRALEFIKRIVEECVINNAYTRECNIDRRARARAIISQLYDLMIDQGVDEQTLSLVKTCRDDFDDLLANMGEDDTISKATILKAREDARRRREEEARYRGRC